LRKRVEREGGGLAVKGQPYSSDESRCSCMALNGQAALSCFYNCCLARAHVRHVVSCRACPTRAQRDTPTHLHHPTYQLYPPGALTVGLAVSAGQGRDRAGRPHRTRSRSRRPRPPPREGGIGYQVGDSTRAPQQGGGRGGEQGSGAGVDGWRWRTVVFGERRCSARGGPWRRSTTYRSERPSSTSAHPSPAPHHLSQLSHPGDLARTATERSIRRRGVRHFRRVGRRRRQRGRDGIRHHLDDGPPRRRGRAQPRRQTRALRWRLHISARPS